VLDEVAHGFTGTHPYPQEVATVTLPKPSTVQVMSATTLARFESELEDALRAHEARLQETPELDDISVAIRRQSEEARAEIEGALSRLREGSFGSCERCLTTISSERLEAMPHTRFCRSCAPRDGRTHSRR
jgi:RNA polymerase-binding transcription factor DksA